MTILLPPLENIVTTEHGTINKQILRSESITTDRQVHNIPQGSYYTFKDGGKEYLVLFHEGSKPLINSYRFVLKQASDNLDETASTLDLSHFIWVKHPLLEPSVISRHNKQMVPIVKMEKSPINH